MIYEGQFNGKELKVGIVVSRFNEFISSKLLDGAKDCLFRHEVQKENIDTLYVPGAFEIPLVTKLMTQKDKYDLIITLGAVIRGATTHYDLVANEVAKGIASLSLQTDTPIMFGVLTTETIEQAIERAGTKAGNKGFEVALAGLELANLKKQYVTSI